MTCAEMRALEKRAIEEAGITAAVLMENAGRAVAEEALRMAPAGPIVIACGRGNNGGDGFVAARHLDNGGAPVKVIAIDPARLQGDALANYRALRFSGVEILSIGSGWIGEFTSALSGAALVIDALFGTGLSGALRDPWPALVDAINTCGVPVLAVDIPSGLDADTGEPPGVAVRATRTVTFHAAKDGFETGRPFTGEVVIADIGIPRRLA